MREGAYNQLFDAPSGLVRMNANHHLSKPARIGQVQSDGQFRVVVDYTDAIAPVPWNNFIASTAGYACDHRDGSTVRTEGVTGSFFQVPSVRVGLLHALSGELSSQEEHDMLRGELLAINEINAELGLLGKTLVPLIIDSRSSVGVHANQARAMIDNRNVASVFSSGPATLRRAAAPLFEQSEKVRLLTMTHSQTDHVLQVMWYGSPFEGAECSSRVLYFGQTPSNQIEPALAWLRAKDHRTVFPVVLDDSAGDVLAANISRYVRMVAMYVTTYRHAQMSQLCDQT